MADLWFISDLHLGHSNILGFHNYDGSKVRPFSTLKEMHECIFDRWNETVKKGDKVYVLGDVAFGAIGRDVMLNMAHLPGKKKVILGNHDGYQHSLYGRVFQEIYGFKNINGLWCSHPPIHRQSIAGRNAIGNVHGHLHNNVVGEPGYFNVSCERINYTPINRDEVIAKLKDGGIY